MITILILALLGRFLVFLEGLHSSVFLSKYCTVWVRVEKFGVLSV